MSLAPTNRRSHDEVDGAGAATQNALNPIPGAFRPFPVHSRRTDAKIEGAHTRASRACALPSTGVS